MNVSADATFTTCKTWLFVPATKIDRVPKAFASGADAVIVDFEDTVAQVNKADARQALHDYYEHKDSQALWVRINKASSEAFVADITMCQQLPRLAGIVLAKAEQAADIEKTHRMTGLPIIALIETALGLYNVDAMAKVVGLSAFSYGFLDLCNDLSVQVDTIAADTIANQIRYQLLLTSRVHGLSPPIDTVYPDFGDHDGLSDRVKLWSQMGMSGMLCIHPKQVATVNNALVPTEAERDFAKLVIEEYERSGQAVFKVAGNMIDAPVIERCYRVLAKRRAD